MKVIQGSRKRGNAGNQKKRNFSTINQKQLFNLKSIEILTGY